jgi:hypothetical protein
VLAESTLLWAARHGRPTLNGTGAFAPSQTHLLARVVENHWLAVPPEDADASKATSVLLERFPVRYVILPLGRRPDLDMGGLAAAFERSRTFRLVAAAADGDRLYEVRPP